VELATKKTEREEDDAVLSFKVVEVVLRYFHRCRYWNSTVVVLLLEGHRLLGELAIREYGVHENLRGSGRRSVIPYIHG
jgi:hypothetical protein